MKTSWSFAPSERFSVLLDDDPEMVAKCFEKGEGLDWCICWSGVEDNLHW